VLLRFGYHLVLLDTSPDTTNPVTQYALQRAQQMVLIGEQNYFTAELVNEAVEDLLESHAGQQTTVVLNRVESDPGAGDVKQVQAKLRAHTDGPQVVIPHDRQLARSLAAGRYDLDAVARPTRLPLKHLALDVVERLV
jgi:MinD-like ATPase involved in chromosome partitioning or flagellar assembly